MALKSSTGSGTEQTLQDLSAPESVVFWITWKSKRSADCKSIGLNLVRPNRYPAACFTASTRQISAVCAPHGSVFYECCKNKPIASISRPQMHPDVQTARRNGELSWFTPLGTIPKDVQRAYLSKSSVASMRALFFVNAHAGRTVT
jgi:hypothetical protein